MEPASDNTPPLHHSSTPCARPRIARVIVDIALDREFDYLIPAELDSAVRSGAQVRVPFGRREVKGYVVGLADTSDHDQAKLKPILGLVGKKALVEDNILALARWISDYYLAPIERCVRTVLPGAVRKKGTAFKERLFVIALDKAGDAEAVAALRKAAEKQAAAIDTLVPRREMFLQELAYEAGVSSQAIRGLEKKGFVRIVREAQLRDPHDGMELLRTQPLGLMPQQAAALERVKACIDTLKPPVVLLHGVTGSGKTEVYLQAISHAMASGRGAIVLVPEIALTPQTVERFRGRFGDCIAVLHSHLSEGERHDEWHRIHEGKATIAIGARSALFAPVKDLGLIVVDEEHEPTYKQEEAPRYNARDVAVMRGHMEKCAVVLGSATPSLESWYNARKGKYELVHMPLRVDEQKMPAMRIVDMRGEKEREGRINVLSRDLCTAIEDRIGRAEQTMLFLNRRGFATSLICPKCGYVATCDQCSVAYTFHKAANRLICHICGTVKDVPSRCPEPACRDPSFRFAGIGTQRVEDVIAKIFSKARVQRMDSDTMTRKDAYRTTLGDFRSGKIDILIGTQMIAKGLHFPNVTLVGVINADLSLHMPDFRAGERTFQLLTQVAGRAGRGDVVGEVIVQTFTPFHPAIQAARRLDYDGFCDQEVEARKELDYPPFSHVVCMTLRGAVEEKVSLTAATFMKQLKPLLDRSVIAGDPTPAPMAKAKGLFRYQMIFRAPTTRRMVEPLRALLKTFAWPDDVEFAVDVDALSLM
jgi:primosomal protein N' (replication factor Y)